MGEHHPTNDELRGRKRGCEHVPVPELGPDWVLCIGAMSAAGRVSFEAAIADAPREEWPGLLVSRAAQHHETGARRFTDEDAAWLNHEVDWSWVARCFRVAARLNGLEAGAVEATAKN
jgi:hypothetical protein